MNDYTLKTSEDSSDEKRPMKEAFSKMFSLMKDEKKDIIISLIGILLNAVLVLIAPLLLGYTIDKYVVTKQYQGLFIFSGILLAIYIGSFITSYIQIRVMGGVGQRVLFKLRNAVFTKLQELPLAFFNQNKTGDLISRINNDTQKLNDFFSQSLMQFAGNAFIILGAGIFVIVINPKLGLASLAPALGLFVLTQLVSSWVKNNNLRSLQAEGALSAEVQESLANFKVILAFNRRDYFKQKFEKANTKNFKASVKAGLANNLFSPVYDFASNIAQMIVLAYGIYLIAQGEIAIGIVVSFLIYMNRFYDPLRMIASLWSAMQIALAGWDRISEILHMESDLKIVPHEGVVETNSLLKFKNVSFHYPNGQEVLHKINFNLEKGKTYALVGPTGGGKTTTASLIARLYDPSSGQVLLEGKDIRSYKPEERTAKIGFILQEPILLTGTVGENILYGNPNLADLTAVNLQELLKKEGLETLLERFEEGLNTKITNSGETLSLGQRQLIAFIRAVLRKPALLILDEATANIDTVTEEVLQDILNKLPKETTRVIIAHRLNTIENADEIFFINSGSLTPAGSMEHAVEMLLSNKRKS